MAALTTEQQHPDASGLDARPLSEIAEILHAGQVAALAAVGGATSEIAMGAALMAQAIRAGRNLVYVAAGSSGLMALADAAELEGTFGIPPQQVSLHMAGGVPIEARMPGATEDDVEAAEAAAQDVAAGDVVIALSASGSTPYPLAFMKVARSKGAHVIAIANNPGAPMLEQADVAVLLQTPPEVIAGSTRMGAGSAQKVALNMMSTLMGAALGHVHDGMMVNVLADNEKLRTRAAGMVARITGVPEARALDCLEQSDGAVKPAILLAAGAGSAEQAAALLTETDGLLRPALERL